MYYILHVSFKSRIFRIKQNFTLKFKSFCTLEPWIVLLYCNTSKYSKSSKTCSKTLSDAKKTQVKSPLCFNEEEDDGDDDDLANKKDGHIPCNCMRGK